MKIGKTVTVGPARGLAFTLIELLVVIVIIALLAALLLPALGNAKKQSLKNQCINGQKQLAVAMQMYATDSKDWLAFCNWDLGADQIGTSGFGPGWLYNSSCVGLDPLEISGEYANNSEAAFAKAKGLWWPYVQQCKSYWCPVDILSKYYPMRNNQLCSYVMNGSACGFGDGQPSGKNPGAPASCKISQIWSPACFVFWEPDDQLPGAGAKEFNDGANYPGLNSEGVNEGIGPFHDNHGGNITRLDGGVQFITTNDFLRESAAPGRSHLWWSVFSANGH